MVSNKSYEYASGYDAYFKYRKSRWENPYERFQGQKCIDWDNGWLEAWTDLNEK